MTFLPTHLVTLLAQAAPPDNSFMAILQSIAPFILLFILFYFLFIKPQKKEQQRLEKLRDELQVGQEVITNFGLFGKISSIEEKTIHLEITRGTRIKILKSQIAALASELSESKKTTVVEEK